MIPNLTLSGDATHRYVILIDRRQEATKQSLFFHQCRHFCRGAISYVSCCGCDTTRDYTPCDICKRKGRK